jgi:capsular polysaccharide transport system ATP-binding protein
MINLQNVTKDYSTRHGKVRVVDDVSLTIAPGQKIGLVGLNGAGKSTLIRLISGIEQQTSGVIRREMSVSWPLAFSGGFQGSLTGLDNLRCICRIYGLDAKKKVAALEEFSELGRYLREPVKTYSAGMRARLAFAISLVVEFDCFLIDEIVSVGDSRFQARCEYELFEKRGDRSFVFASHSAEFIKHHCHSAAVMIRGQMRFFGDVDAAYDFYQETCQ